MLESSANFVQSQPEAPPIANRGCVTHAKMASRAGNAVFDKLADPFMEGVDWLTITVPKLTTSDHLHGLTELIKIGGPAQGFMQTERRRCNGGECWRRFEPHQASKDYGHAYECWEWDGAAARSGAEGLIGWEGRPSRIDIQFTSICDAGVTPAMIYDVWSPISREKGIRDRLIIEHDVSTAYFGKPSSGRSIRVYRKDLQSEEFAMIFGPCMRVEVTLTGKRCQAWWKLYQTDEKAAYAAAAKHIEEMTGGRVRNAVADVLPALVMPEALNQSQKFLSFAEQYGDFVVDHIDSGVDVVQLLREWSGRARNRMSLKRSSDRRARIAEMRPHLFVRAVRSFMRHKLAADG